MKRVLVILIAACITFGCCGCSPSKPSNMDDVHYSAGKAVLEIVDDYLNFKVTSSEAVSRIDAISDTLKKQPETDYSDPVHFGNYLVQSALTGLSFRVRIEDLNEVVVRRNTLASYLNLPERK